LFLAYLRIENLLQLFCFLIYDSAVLKALLSRVMEKKDEYGDSWHMVRQNLLFMYKEALSSNCGDLVQMIQVGNFFIKADIMDRSH